MLDPKYIQINLPLTAEDYAHGNGEGVWVEVDRDTRAAYDRDAVGPGYCGVLANDSLYYPGLCCGELICFEMRGQYRPVADIRKLHDRIIRLTETGKEALLRKIAEAQNLRFSRPSDDL